MGLGHESLEPVDVQIQAQPHHIHKVPIPRRTFETKVALGSEVAFHQTQGDEQFYLLN